MSDEDDTYSIRLLEGVTVTPIGAIPQYYMRSEIRIVRTMVTDSGDETPSSERTATADTQSGKASDGIRKHVDRRRFLQTTTAGVVGSSLAGCLSTFSSEEEEGGDGEDGGDGGDGGDIDGPIKIGVLAPEPEDNPIGMSIANGAELAVEQLNEDGGIGGADVEIVVEDTGEDPAEGQRRYQDLVVEEEVDVTAGVFTSEVLLNIMGDISQHQVPHLTTGAATTEASRMVNEEYDSYKYHFRVGPVNDRHLGQNLVDFAEANFENMGWESVAVLVEDFTWTGPISEVLDESLGETGVEVATSNRYAGGTENFGPIYDDIDEGVDAAFTAMAHTGTTAVVQWAKQQRPFAFGGIHVPMQLPSYYESVDGACRYGITQTSATATSELTENTQPFVQAYEEKYDGSLPVYTGYITYDAIKLYADAVEQAETADSDEIVSTLEGISFTGTTGTIEFYGQDEEYTHDVVYGEENAWPIYLQWQENDDGEGVQEVIWPEEEATSEYVPPAWL